MGVTVRSGTVGVACNFLRGCACRCGDLPPPTSHIPPPTSPPRLPPPQLPPHTSFLSPFFTSPPSLPLPPPSHPSPTSHSFMSGKRWEVGGLRKQNIFPSSGPVSCSSPDATRLVTQLTKPINWYTGDVLLDADSRREKPEPEPNRQKNPHRTFMKREQNSIATHAGLKTLESLIGSPMKPHTCLVTPNYKISRSPIKLCTIPYNKPMHGQLPEQLTRLPNVMLV